MYLGIGSMYPSFIGEQTNEKTIIDDEERQSLADSETVQQEGKSATKKFNIFAAVAVLVGVVVIMGAVS